MHKGPLPLPLRVEDFDIENSTMLGCGAVAFVNRCTHGPTGVPVAVKILSKIQLLQQNKVASVHKEKEALYALGPHPSFPYLFGTMQSDDELYFAMELLPNGDLLEHIRRVVGKRQLAQVSSPPSLSYADTKLITAQLLIALQRVFQKGYVLRDLKPENICFRSNGRVCIVDFDTALSNAPQPLSNGGGVMHKDRTGEEKQYNKVSEVLAARRQSAAFCGTAHYVAPETLGDCVWSFASDLFALGCVIYHMLAGEPLFSGPNAFFVMREIRNGVQQKTFPDSVKQCPGAEALIRGLLATDPVLRTGVARKITSEAAETPSGESGDKDKKEEFYFELDIFKMHPFFNDFDWSPVEAVNALDVANIATSDNKLPIPDVFNTSVKPPARSSSSGDDEEEEESQGPQPVKLSALPFLRYDDFPVHSDDYALYVHRVGDGPLERCLDPAVAAAVEHATEAVRKASVNCLSRSDADGDAAACSVENEASEKKLNDSGDDCDMEDDVGAEVMFAFDSKFREIFQAEDPDEK